MRVMIWLWRLMFACVLLLLVLGFCVFLFFIGCLVWIVVMI
jgi:hypothetical protein